MATRAWKQIKGSCNPRVVLLTGVWTFESSGELSEVKTSGFEVGKLRLNSTHRGQQKLTFGTARVPDRYVNNSNIGFEAIATKPGSFADGASRFGLIIAKMYHSIHIRWFKPLVTPSGTISDYIATKSDMVGYTARVNIWYQNSDKFDIGEG